ncbi:hypothetical protein [Streptomyces sp. NPDC047315]|uniref:hypothetical protein n=1 Tax=Streptomyces sp. NPDC047315 TaxID=3155142 RepID=UPI003411A1DE
MAPETFNARFKGICAALDIPTTTVTDAFGRTDVLINRDGMQRLRDAADATGFPEIAEALKRLLEAGGRPS